MSASSQDTSAYLACVGGYSRISYTIVRYCVYPCGLPLFPGISKCHSNTAITVYVIYITTPTTPTLLPSFAPSLPTPDPPSHSSSSGPPWGAGRSEPAGRTIPDPSLSSLPTPYRSSHSASPGPPWGRGGEKRARGEHYPYPTLILPARPRGLRGSARLRRAPASSAAPPPAPPPRRRRAPSIAMTGAGSGPGPGGGGGGGGAPRAARRAAGCGFSGRACQGRRGRCGPGCVGRSCRRGAAGEAGWERKGWGVGWCQAQLTAAAVDGCAPGLDPDGRISTSSPPCDNDYGSQPDAMRSWEAGTAAPKTVLLPPS